MLLNNFLFYRIGLLAPRPTPIPEDQASVLFISPEAGWLPILVASYDTHGLFLRPLYFTAVYDPRLSAFVDVLIIYFF
jgi:hypothetical protein